MILLPLAVSVAVAGPFGALSPVGMPIIADRPVPPAVVTPSGEATTPGDVPAASPGRWSAPVTPVQVHRGFEAPAQRWLPGHRGVDLRASAGSVVRAPADGRIAFSGMVAGRPVVSVDHVDPRDPTRTIRTTYEPVHTSQARGAMVRRGQVVGSVVDDSHCPGGCVHWGAIRGEEYVDPLAFLRGRVRLWTPVQRG